MDYKLLAADMDGTALNSQKILTSATVAAIKEAIAKGKHVVFATGRPLSLIRPYLAQVGDMRYALTCSGSSVLELNSGRSLLHSPISSETAKKLVETIKGRDIMPMYYRGGECFANLGDVNRCAEFGLQAYEPIYRRCMNMSEDVLADFLRNPSDIDKMNIHFRSEDDTREVMASLSPLPICFSTVSPLSLEINAAGVSKAKGLTMLCEELGISLSECIAVGDADNDAEMLEVVGMAAVMGNGQDEVKKIADYIAPDCDSDGLVSVINNFLL